MHAVVTVDLKNKVTSEERAKFNDAMAAKQWKKVSGITTAWKAVFKDSVSADGARSTTLSDVKKCAADAGIALDQVSAIVQVGDDAPATL
jgi:hypothetical protein